MMKLQQEQNNHKINQMMEMMKFQKQSETEIKCPKWEKEENLKHFLNRLKRRNEIEKGKGKVPTITKENKNLVLEKGKERENKIFEREKKKYQQVQRKKKIF